MSLPTESSGTDEDFDQQMFVKSGFTEDEVIINFSHGKKLFVSKSFLIYTSSVFEVMMSSNFTEGTTGTIDMEGRSYEDFLTFLKCLTPRNHTAVNEDNVLTVLPLAHMFQVDKVVKDCVRIMKNIVSVEPFFGGLVVSPHLKILRLANMYNMESLVRRTVKSLRNQKITTWGKLGKRDFECLPKDLQDRLVKQSEERFRY